MIRQFFKGLVLAGAFVVLSLDMAAAAVFHVSATTGNDGGDGSQASPWRSVSGALDSGRVKGGDTVVVQAGEYGVLRIVGKQYRKPVEIRAAEGTRPHFEYIGVFNSSNLRFRGFDVWPLRPEDDNQALVYTEGNTDAIAFSDLDVRAIEQAGRYMSWSERDWFRYRKTGVLMFGARGELHNSTITGTSFAIATNGHRSIVSGNRVLGFSGDAMRGIGPESVFSGNLVQDCVKIDDNHDDGFQSWSLGPNGNSGGGTLVGLLIEKNRIYEWTGRDDHPLRCDLQGIGLYDGIYRNVIIRNNVIVNSAWHGIVAGGIVDSQIVNNTLVRRDGPSQEKPWIGVFVHKDGRPSVNVVVANNAVPRISVDDQSRRTLIERNNAVIPYPARELMAPYRQDLRPKPGSSLIDRAAPEYAPKDDIDGNPRPRGRAPDIGAFEVQ